MPSFLSKRPGCCLCPCDVVVLLLVRCKMMAYLRGRGAPLKVSTFTTASQRFYSIGSVGRRVQVAGCTTLSIAITCVAVFCVCERCALRGYGDRSTTRECHVPYSRVAVVLVYGAAQRQEWRLFVVLQPEYDTDARVGATVERRVRSLLTVGASPCAVASFSCGHCNCFGSGGFSE